MLRPSENFLIGLDLSEYHSGYRAYSCIALKEIQFDDLSDDFVFDTDIIINFKMKNISIDEIIIPTSYDEKSHVISFWLAMKVGFGILASAIKYWVNEK